MKTLRLLLAVLAVALPGSGCATRIPSVVITRQTVTVKERQPVIATDQDLLLHDQLRSPP